MFTFKKALSVLLALALITSCAYGALHYHILCATAVPNTAEELPDTEAGSSDMPALEPVVAENKNTSAEPTPSPSVEAPPLQSSPDAPDSDSSTGEEQPYWIQDNTYAELIAAYDAAVEAAPLSGYILDASFTVLSDGEAHVGEVTLDERILRSNGTNAPLYDNNSGILLTPTSGLPQKNMRSDRSVLKPVENSEDSVYEATFYFESKQWPQKPFCAFKTYVVFEGTDITTAHVPTTPTSVPDNNTSGKPGQTEFVNISDGWPEFESLAEQLEWLRANGYADVADGYLASRFFNKNTALSPLVTGSGTPFSETTQLNYTITDWTNMSGGQTDSFYGYVSLWNGYDLVNPYLNTFCVSPGYSSPNIGLTSTSAYMWHGFDDTYNGVAYYDAYFYFEQSNGPFLPFQTLQATDWIGIYWNYYGYLDLQKVSALPALTNGNDNYSLQGAQYGVYSNAGCTNLVASGYTDWNGFIWYANWSNGGSFLPGWYYVKELLAPRGYAQDTYVYSVYVSGGQTSHVNGGAVYDQPLLDPAYALVEKLDSATGEAWGRDDPEGASLAGAEFTVRYWDGYYGTIEEAEASGTPTRTWVLATVEGGRLALDFSNTYCLVSGDTLYLRPDGRPAFPLGTVAIQETKAPASYLLPDPNPVSLQQIKPTGLDMEPVTRLNALTILEEPHEARVIKLDADTNEPIADTEFTLYKESAVGSGVWEKIDSHITDESGAGVFSPLSVGSYKLTETRPNSAYQSPDEAGTAPEQYFTITNDTELVELTFFDYLLKTVDVTKLDVETEEPVSNTEFCIYSYPVDVSEGLITTDTGSIPLDDPSWIPVGKRYVYNAAGNVVEAESPEAGTNPVPLTDTLITDAYGKLTFVDLPFGFYKIDETRSNPLYGELEESGDSAHMFTLDKTSTGEAQVFKNLLIQVSIEVYKQTIARTSSAHDATKDTLASNVGIQEYLYHFGARSVSNVRVDEFVITDSLEYLTSKGYRMTTLWTGTTPKGLDHDGLMHLLYKTNTTEPDEPVVFEYNPLLANPANANNPDRKMSVSTEPGWRVWAECLSTEAATRLEVADLGLDKGEYITAIRVVYGGVTKGFHTGRGFEDSADPHTNKGDKDERAAIETLSAGEEPDPNEEPDPFELRDWYYAVLATEALLPLDEIGDETVLNGSIRADLSRNWADTTPVLTDIDKDKTATRLFESFSIPTINYGLSPTSWPGDAPGRYPSLFLPQTGDNTGFLVALALVLIAGGVGCIIAFFLRTRAHRREKE